MILQKAWYVTMCCSSMVDIGVNEEGGIMYEDFVRRGVNVGGGVLLFIFLCDFGASRAERS